MQLNALNYKILKNQLLKKKLKIMHKNIIYKYI